MSPVNRTSHAPRLSRVESQARTRAALIAAAGEVFAERGYHGASVEEIVARAGFTRGAFGPNFADKDDLFLAVIDARFASGVAEMTPLLRAAGSVDDLIDDLKELRRAVPEDPMWRILLAEFRLHALRNPDLRPRLAAREEDQRRRFRTAIEHMAAVVGVEPPVDLDLLVLIVQVLDDGIAFHHDIEGDAIAPHAFLDALDFLTRAGVALAGQQPAGGQS